MVSPNRSGQVEPALSVFLVDGCIWVDVCFRDEGSCIDIYINICLPALGCLKRGQCNYQHATHGVCTGVGIDTT